MAYSHDSFIANSKTFSIYISISCSWTFSGTICNFESYGASVGFGFDNSKALVVVVLIALKTVSLVMILISLS